MNKIAFIDFETANHQSHSACQLGIVVVESWRIVSEHEWLIRPARMYFSPQCVRVHGITPRDVLQSPTWDRIWTDVAPVLDGAVIVAHNVGFDAAVLQATSLSCDIALPNFDLQCTRLIGKRSWPGLPSYGLASITEQLGIQFRHHNALEDARASARVAIAAAEKHGCDSLEALEDRLGVDRGRMWLDQIRQPRTVRRSRIETVAEPQPRYQPKLFRTDGTPPRTEQLRTARHRGDQILAACGEERPFAGKFVVLFHNLLGMEREDSVAFLSQLGATVQPQINLQTHYVVVGTPTRSQHTNSTDNATAMNDTNDESAPTQQILARQKEGQPIRVLSQRQLLACIPSGLAIARGDLT